MKKYGIAIMAALCLSFVGAVGVLPGTCSVAAAYGNKSEEGYLIHYNNYFIRYYEPFDHYANVISCEYHKPDRIEFYKIKFFPSYFVVLETDADRNEIGIQQYYNNNPGTYKVMGDARNRGFIHF